MTDAEARVTHAALDLFSRIMTGQLEEVERVLRDYYLVSTPTPGPWSLGQLNALDDAIREAKAALGLPRNGSHGIYHPRVHPAARLARSLLRRAEDGEDEIDRKLAAEADEGWRAKHGEPWYGRPVTRPEVPR